MSDEVLGSLLKDHDSMRALRRVLAEEVDRLEQRSHPDWDRMRAVMRYTMHDPASYHHLFEGFLIDRLIERRPEAERVTHLVERKRHRVERLGTRLEAWLSETEIKGLLQRLRFIRLARKYVALHEALLETEENQLFPLLQDGLTPGDWVEATTVFEWSIRPDAPRHLIGSTYPRGQEQTGEIDIDRRRSGDGSAA